MKEQQPAGACNGSRTLPLTRFHQAKYHLPTASFIVLIKKGKKQQVCFFTELLVKLITGWI